MSVAVGRERERERERGRLNETHDSFKGHQSREKAKIILSYIHLSVKGDLLIVICASNVFDHALFLGQIQKLTNGFVTQAGQIVNFLCALLLLLLLLLLLKNTGHCRSSRIGRRGRNRISWIIIVTIADVSDARC